MNSIPGIDGAKGRPTGRTAGPDSICLIVGRADDIEIKGVDIAARAFAQLPDELVRSARPQLWIRGASASGADALHSMICQEHGLHRSDLVVRGYSPDDGRIAEDLRRAAVLLMPSRADGFGLAGLEALSLATPVLISDRSGACGRYIAFQSVVSIMRRSCH